MARWIDTFERELSRISTSKRVDAEAYLAGCEAAMREVIDAIGGHPDPLDAIAAVARKPTRTDTTNDWRAGRLDTLRLLGNRVRAGDMRPINWTAMR